MDKLSNTGVDAREALQVSGRRWLGDKPNSGGQQTLLARFVVGNMYMGSVHLPRDDVSDTFCPICLSETLDGILLRSVEAWTWRGLGSEKSHLWSSSGI